MYKITNISIAMRPSVSNLASMRAEHFCTSTTAESRAKIWYQ